MTATSGGLSAKTLLSPRKPLYGNTTYEQAITQLPGGSVIPLFVRFGPISQLLSRVARHNKDREAIHALKQLNYLILGETPSDVRVVLDLK